MCLVKHTSFLQYGINYGFEQLYDIGLRLCQISLKSISKIESRNFGKLDHFEDLENNVF